MREREHVAFPRTGGKTAQSEDLAGKTPHGAMCTGSFEPCGLPAKRFKDLETSKDLDGWAGRGAGGGSGRGSCVYSQKPMVYKDWHTGRLN
jgi:hypothetical protein